MTKAKCFLFYTSVLYVTPDMWMLIAFNLLSMHIHAILIQTLIITCPSLLKLTLWFVPLRLIVRGGNSSLSPPLFDSDLDDVPERGLLSESATLYLELTADSSSIPLLLALRYEGEQRHFSFPHSEKYKVNVLLHILSLLMYHI